MKIQVTKLRRGQFIIHKKEVAEILNKNRSMVQIGLLLKKSSGTRWVQFFDTATVEVYNSFEEAQNILN
jgi:hypothetical protein